MLDSCGVAHLLGDGDPQLAAVRPDGPLLDAASLVLFGFHPAQLSAGQWRRFAAMAFTASRSPPCHREPLGAAQARPWPGCKTSAPCCVTWTSMSSTTRSSRWPTGPRYHGGLSLSDAFGAVAAAAAHPGLACLTVTEVNPDHDPTGELTKELVSRWTAAIAAG